ncbi:MFS transporter [Metarhizium robertsii]|uniref:MFS transporter n=1 Tax=Metarhizium robertsii TaxID=568076 RepID=A0A014PBV0_9HYPO|nr:MFS transporter [Metarhizium robertsii]
MVISKTIQHGSNHEKPAVVTDSVGSNADASPSHETTEFVLSKDGFKLFPQPILGDHLDPLNWSFAQKHIILAIIMSIYFMFTFITTTTVPSFPELEENYAASLEQMNWTVAIPALGLAVGPLLWASPADIIGRRPIIILGTAMALAATVGAALAPNYSGYMAARFFQGLGVSPASNVGLAVINDLFFEHERGQKVGLWVLAIDLGLLFGPLIGGAVDLAGYVWIQWLSAILFGVMLLAELLLLPETLYPRHLMLSEQHRRRHPCTDADKAAPSYHDAERFKIPRTKKLAFMNVAPVPGVRHPKPFDTICRFIKTFKYAVVPISIMTYCFGWYWWVLSVVTLVPTAYAKHSPQIQGVLYLGLIIGTLVSEVCCSGSLSDCIVLHLSKRNHHQKTPEMRIWLAYPAAALTAVGLIVWGVSVDRGYHWIVGQVAFAIFGAGIQMGNTAICSYVVDAYPMQSMAMMTFYAVMLNLSAFIDPFFVVPWVENVGFTWTMAGHAIITVFFCIPVLALLHRFGRSLRDKSGQPTWVNPEFERCEGDGASWC